VGVSQLINITLLDLLFDLQNINISQYKYCQPKNEKEIYCESPDELTKGKTNLPPMAFTNITASGTVSGATVSTTRSI